MSASCRPPLTFDPTSSRTYSQWRSLVLPLFHPTKPWPLFTTLGHTAWTDQSAKRRWRGQKREEDRGQEKWSGVRKRVKRPLLRPVFFLLRFLFLSVFFSKKHSSTGVITGAWCSFFFKLTQQRLFSRLEVLNKITRFWSSLFCSVLWLPLLGVAKTKRILLQFLASKCTGKAWI